MCNNGIQYGVVSRGYGCGWVGYPGIYTKVVPFLPWIKSLAGKYNISQNDSLIFS